MAPTEWFNLLREVGRRKHLKGWKDSLGTLFTPFITCLKKTGDYVRGIECKICSCHHEVFPDKNSNGFVAFCRCEDRDCEDIFLTTEMAQAWELSGKLLGEKLGRALGVTSDFNARDNGNGLFDLGECQNHPERRHIWLCTGYEQRMPNQIVSFFQHKDIGCVIVSNKVATIARPLIHAGIVIIPIETAFTCIRGKIHSDCKKRCRHVSSNHTKQTEDRYNWVRQAELVRALHRVLGKEESPDKTALTRASQEGVIQTNGATGRECRYQVDSVKAWLIKKYKLATDEVQQVVDAMIAEIRNRKS